MFPQHNLSLFPMTFFLIDTVLYKKIIQNRIIIYKFENNKLK